MMVTSRADKSPGTSCSKAVALNLGFFFLYSKAFSPINFSVMFRASNRQLVDKKN